MTMGVKIFASFAVVLALVGVAPVSRAGEAPVVVMLGDSLTAGYGLPEDQALPVQVGTALAALGIDAEMVNAGMSGDTTGGGLDRYDWSVRSADPDLLLIALGANDFLRGLSAEATTANLSKIIETAQGDGVDVVLISVEARSTELTDSREAAFAAIYPSLAETYDVTHYRGLLDGVRDRPELLQPDGLHPTAEGVRLMAERLAAFLTPYIEELGSQS